MTATGAPPVRLLQRGFVAWLSAATVSATGDGVLFFALAWTASGLGPGTAAAVLVAGLVPEVLLVLVGGAAADRWGVRRTVLLGSAAVVALTALALAALRLEAPLAPTLVVVSALLGVVFAFLQPAHGVLPRLFFAEEGLARGMALTGTVLSLARLVGPPLGAVVVAVLALEGALALDLVSCVGVLVVLLLVRPPYEPPRALANGSALAEVRRGLAAVRRLPGVLPLLGSLALVAGGLLPVLSLGIPLLARERGWQAHDAGVVEACWIAGTLVVGILVSRVGTRERAAAPLLVGSVLAASGVVGLVAAPGPVPAAVAALLMGVGTAVYTTHVFPLYILRSPADMLARFQSVLVVVQLGATLLGSALLGLAAAHAGAGPALLLAATACAAAVLPPLASPSLREAATR